MTARTYLAYDFPLLGAFWTMLWFFLRVMWFILLFRIIGDIFVTTRQYVFEFDLTGWGWVHLALGAVAVIVSIGLLRTAMWARVAGVAIAGLVVIANFLSLPYYPVWSVVMIALSAVIIWALCVVRRDNLYDLSERPPDDV